MSQLSVHAALGQITQLRQMLKGSDDMRRANGLDEDRDRRPLHWAAARGHPRCVELLLQYGADPNLPDASGATALELAERNGFTNCAFLLKHGAPVADPKRIECEGQLSLPGLW